MFTTSSKFYLALTVLTVVSFGVYMVFIGPSSIGATALVGLFAVGILFSWLSLHTRDADADDEFASGANADVPSRSIWPLVGAVGTVLALVGTVTSPLFFILGLVIVIAVFVEWGIQAWADRASSDPVYNASVRAKILHPIEFPVLAAVGLAVVILSFAEIMLAVERSAGAVLFIIVSSWVLAAGTVVALRPTLRRGVVTVIAVVGTVAMVAGGLLANSVGMRAELVEAAEEGHYLHRKCGPEKDKYGDKLALETVSARSAVIAIVEFVDGRLIASEQGVPMPREVITIQRSNPSSIIFRNRTDGEFRLVAVTGKTEVSEGVFKVDERCTQLIPSGAEQILTLTMLKPTMQTGDFFLKIAGVDGQQVELSVP
jgi:hypothetical protein